MSQKRFANGFLIFASMVLMSCFFTMMLVKAWDQEEATKPIRSQVIMSDPNAAYNDFQLRAMFIRREGQQK